MAFCLNFLWTIGIYLTRACFSGLREKGESLARTADLPFVVRKETLRRVFFGGPVSNCGIDRAGFGSAALSEVARP